MYIYDTYIDFDVASVSEGGSRTSLTERQTYARIHAQHTVYGNGGEGGR